MHTPASLVQYPTLKPLHRDLFLFQQTFLSKTHSCKQTHTHPVSLTVTQGSSSSLKTPAEYMAQRQESLTAGLERQCLCVCFNISVSLTDIRLDSSVLIDKERVNNVLHSSLEQSYVN